MDAPHFQDVRNGVLLAYGDDSVGFLARSLRWFKRKSEHTYFAWDAACIRNVGELSFTILHYRCDEQFHRRLCEGRINDFSVKEKQWAPEHECTVESADSLLSSGSGTPRNYRPFFHFYCSFSHAPEQGFIERLCQALTEKRICIVQHDAILTRDATSDNAGHILHAMRCYAPSALSAFATFSNCYKECVGVATNGGTPPQIEILERPDPSLGLLRGWLPPQVRFGQEVACLYFVGDIRNHDVNDDEAFERVAPATQLLMHLANLVESTLVSGNSAENGAGRPLLRLGMRSIGGWAFAFACVGSNSPYEVEELAPLLKERMRHSGAKNAGNAVCEGRMLDRLPWATDDRSKKLGILRHPDRMRYLHDYFSYIGEYITERVSVVQYDSWASVAVPQETAVARAAHQICIAGGSNSELEAFALREEWVRRHDEFPNRRM